MSMYEKEWECCGDVTITKSWQPEKCPFCTAPPSKQWQSLTGDEIDDIAAESGFGYINVARAIEAKLREKNT